MDLKITINNQLNSFWIPIFGTVCSAAYLFFYNHTILAWEVMTSLWLLNTLPAAYLHIEYYLRNKGEEITIDFDELILKKNGTVQKYRNSDFQKIILYIGGGANSGALGFQYYFFTRLITTKQEEIIITCLMTRKMKEALKILGAPYEIKALPLFRSLRFGRLKK